MLVIKKQYLKLSKKCPKCIKTDYTTWITAITERSSKNWLFSYTVHPSVYPRNRNQQHTIN